MLGADELMAFICRRCGNPARVQPPISNKQVAKKIGGPDDLGAAQSCPQRYAYLLTAIAAAFHCRLMALRVSSSAPTGSIGQSHAQPATQQRVYAFRRSVI